MKGKNVKKALSVIMCSLIIGTGSLTLMPSRVSATSNAENPLLKYHAHVQSYGWEKNYQTASNNGEKVVEEKPVESEVAGTLGKSKRMEALEINFKAPDGVKLKYRAHVQSYGWMNWVTADNKENTGIIGTTGESKRIEALQIVVEGLSNYVVKYRAHVQGYGWLNWVTAGNSTSDAIIKGENFAGTIGESKRMEAFEILVLPLNKVKTETVEPNADNNIEDLDKENNEVEQNPETKVENEQQAEEQNENVVEPQIDAEEQQKSTEPQIVEEQQEPSEPQIEVEPQIKISNEHVHNYTQWQTLKKATCISAGKEERTCLTCEQVESRIIYPDPNAHSIKRTEELDVKASCEMYGKEYYTCTICQTKFFNVTQKPLGHDWEEQPTVDVKRTCTTDGIESVHCTRCSKTKDLKVTPKGHEWKERTTEATCTTNGVTEIYCETCGETRNTQVTQSKLGHEYKEYKYNNDASCTKDGTETAQCTRCEMTNTRTSTAHPKMAHNFSATKTVQERTCTQSGIEEQICQTCGKKQRTVQPATGHKWSTTGQTGNACIGYINSQICTECNAIQHVDKATFGKGHNWNESTGKCKDCGITKPTWTNTWSATYFMPTVNELCKKYTTTYNQIILNHYTTLAKRIKEKAEQANKPEEGTMRHRIVWNVFYTADTTQCNGFNGSNWTYDNVITADHVFRKKAPEPKPGYVFVGWYDTATGIQRTSSTTLETTVNDMDKTFKACYKEI